jgi:peroxiredoxin
MGQEALATTLRAAFLAARDADAPLNARLAMYTRTLEQHLPAYATEVEQLIGRLTAAGAGTSAPNVGEPLPEFMLPDAQGHLVSLSSILRDGPAAIVFLRGHWCPYCRMTADALGRIDNQLRPLGRRIVLLTPERHAFTKMIMAEADASFPVLTDSGNGYALSLNLVVWLGDQIRNILRDFGRDLALYQGEPSWFVPIPATFVVSSAGIITARFVDPDYRRRMDVDALKTALELAA